MAKHVPRPNCTPTGRMRRSFKVSVVLLLAMSAIWVTVTFLEPSSPKFQGKSLRSWAKLAYSGDDTAAGVFRNLGTNAVPELMHLLAEKDSTFRIKLWKYQPKLPAQMRKFLAAH